MRVLLACGPMQPEPGGVPLPGLGLGAADVSEALASGWSAQRPQDVLTLLPLPDGGAGSAQAVAPARVRSREALAAPGPLGDVREVDLLGLEAAAVGPDGSRNGRMSASRSWLLDAARLTSLPAQAGLAAQEAREGTTAGLGLVIAEALRRTRPGDTLVVGMARAAVHDGGAGLIEALGGVVAARRLTQGRDIVLALADGVSLGGLSGAGQGLSALTDLTARQCQDLDRGACATASRLAAELARARPAELEVRAAADGEQSRERGLTVSSWGTGAAGGAALVLRALGARALPGPRVMAALLGLETEAWSQDLLVTAQGEAYDVLADSVPAVVGETAVREALPAVLVTGRSLVPRGELAQAGIVSLSSLQQGSADTPWDEGGAPGIVRRLEAMGRRLARTWSRSAPPTG